MKKIYIFSILFLATFSSSFATDPVLNWAWANRGGGSADDRGLSITADQNGFVYVAGTFNGSATFESTVLTGVTGYNFFLARYDESGNLIWVKGVPSAYAYCNGITTDAQGNCYVTGSFYDTLNFGTVTLINTGSAKTDVFIAKYDVSGNVLWAQSAGQSNVNDDGTAVKVDAAGNVYVAGSFYSSAIVFGTDTVFKTSGSSHFMPFLVKYTSSGTVLWATGPGGSGLSAVREMVLDGNGSIYLGGQGDGELIHGSDTIDPNYDMVLYKFDTDGNPIWVRSAGGAYPDDGWSIALAGDGNIYQLGFANSPTIVFGSDVINLMAASQILLKYDANGNPIWAINARSHSGNQPGAIASDNNGNIYLTGQLTGTSYVGQDTLVASGLADIVFAKYDSSGGIYWGTKLGGGGTDTGLDIFYDNNGSIYLTGWFSGGVAFTPDTINSHGAIDAFVVRLNIPVGIDDIAAGNMFSVFPNPAADQFTVRLNEVVRNAQLEIFDVTGRSMYTAAFTGIEHRIRCDRFPSGIYFIKVQNEKGYTVKKMVVE